VSVAIDSVIAVHAEEVASLFETRAALIRLPHIDPHGLGRLDDRVLAHLDGLAVAGAAAQPLLEAELESPSRGAVFALAVPAIESGRPEALERIWLLAEDAPAVVDGLTTAFGWVKGRQLQGLVRDLLRHPDPARRAAGLAACAMHRTDPGPGSGPWLEDPAPAVRSRALRAVGELGLVDLTPRCLKAMGDDDGECRFWAAWSGVLLGNRGVALDTLRRSALEADVSHRERAFRLAMQAMDAKSAHTTLKALASDSAQLRWLIHGSGIAGDPVYASWLIGHMSKPETARAAGEAFTLVTGADLDALQLWRPQPEDFESGPTEDSDDTNVELDADEGLMWPDPAKVEQWWAANAGRFQKGQRFFMGAPVTRAHCLDVLKNGYQRQRILAAHYLCLLDPGTPLFNTSAPAWRQQRLLARMT
jgi:uncharacterized protein (TIGR02270 family)